MKVMQVVYLTVAVFVATDAVPIGWKSGGVFGWRTSSSFGRGCRIMLCRLGCDYGLKEVDGCQVCECDDPCEDVNCEEGYKCKVQQAKRGGDYTGQCVLDCPICSGLRCEYGPVIRHGCEQCECIEPCSTMLCEEGQTCEVKRDCDKNGKCAYVGECTASDGCEPVTCEMACRYGFKYVDGCEVCECNQSPCEETKCDEGERCEVRQDCPMDAACRYRGECVEGKCNLVCQVVLYLLVSFLDCASIPCRTFCEFGFVKKENGCRMCECKENPCNLVDCKDGYKCEVEKVRDEDGVYDFEADCVEDCPEMSCTVKCEFGYKKTETGCPSCECALTPCATVRCRNGYECQVERSCTSSSSFSCIYSATCAKITSGDLVCPYLASTLSGPCYEACRPGSCDDGELCCSHGCGHSCTKACERLTCQTFAACEYGLAVDDNGCQICECARNPCDTQEIACVFGQKCEAIRNCNDDEICAYEARCVGGCEPVTCEMACRYGFKYVDGCEVCECNQSPCEETKCDEGERCKVRQDCPMDAACRYRGECVEGKCNLTVRQSHVGHSVHTDTSRKTTDAEFVNVKKTHATLLIAGAAVGRLKFVTKMVAVITRRNVMVNKETDKSSKNSRSGTSFDQPAVILNLVNNILQSSH
ncbi:hypothetical protein CAPTEDRAFT_223873 [Capitella teleta]|uniref:Antistasin-like domain-containing protein n=1 Tax=Capitella teleta TaxID=283909 RepID=R7UBR1_CAPTE|nr:hypothetical protein CAPTEDRAFT_223873 [Capitella teleta]|eukprot:ELU03531.1 hypothetical protein CAPTEDRAFT_223873 [Capitella teleta]